MNAKIRTTGQLRDFLATAMQDVIDNKLDIDKASRITKLAGQINESFYAEVKVAQARLEAGGIVTALGAMQLGEGA